MELSKDMRCVFDEENHSYKVGDKDLISVTQLLGAMGITTNYGDVPKTILDAAAEYGTQLHMALESYFKHGLYTEGFASVIDSVVAEFKAQNLKFVDSECLVYDEETGIAGHIDLVCERLGDGISENIHDGELVFIDFKTSSTPNHFGTAWQLSCYERLYKANKPFSVQEWDFDKHDNNKLTVCYLNAVEPNEITRLFDCYKNNNAFVPATLDDQPLLMKCYDLSALIEYHDSEIKRLKAEQDNIKTKLIDEMKKRNIKKFENDHIIITYVAPTTRNTFNTTAFKKDQPDVYDKYLKVSTTAESVRIKIKEDK